jgi:hypothetical protein
MLSTAFLAHLTIFEHVEKEAKDLKELGASIRSFGVK